MNNGHLIRCPSSFYNMDDTSKSILEHKERVNKKISAFVDLLKLRGIHHDDSKLEEPEISGWRQMDLEPRYPYGSTEYFDKLKRYEWVLKEHYRYNSHHLEHYSNFLGEMDLLDIVEMLMDWVSYKDHLTFEETEKVLTQQAARYDLPPFLVSILRNTLLRMFVVSDDFADLFNLTPSELDLKYFEKSEL